MPSLKLLHSLPPVFRKVQLAKKFQKIGGIIPIADIGVASDASEKRDCFAVKALG